MPKRKREILVPMSRSDAAEFVKRYGAWRRALEKMHLFAAIKNPKQAQKVSFRYWRKKESATWAALLPTIDSAREVLPAPCLRVLYHAAVRVFGITDEHAKFNSFLDSPKIIENLAIKQSASLRLV